MSGAATQSRPARDKVNPVYSPIEFERRRKAEIRKQRRMDEAETDDFADSVNAYAALNGKNAQEELDREKRYRRTGKGGNAGLHDFLDHGKLQAKVDAKPTATPAKNPGKPPSSGAGRPAKTQPSRGFSPTAAISSGASSAGGFTLGLLLYGVALSGFKYGMAGVKAYASAKLFNKVLAGPWGGTPSATSSTPSTPTAPPQASRTPGETGPGYNPDNDSR
jgi:hypothetical protein